MNWRAIAADACGVIAFGVTEELVRRTIRGRAGAAVGTAAGAAVGKWVREAVLEVLNGWQTGIA